MDEGIGALIGLVVVIGLVVWLVGVVLTAIAWAVTTVLTWCAWLFISASSMVGSPAVVCVVLCGAGALVGVARHVGAQRTQATRSSDDYATIGPMTMLPEQWAATVLAVFIIVVSTAGGFVLR